MIRKKLLKGKKFAAFLWILGILLMGLSGCGDASSLSDRLPNLAGGEPVSEGRGNSQETQKKQDTEGTGAQGNTDKKSGNEGAADKRQTEWKGELTVSCMFEQEFLRIAAERFEEKYPNVKVQINVYSGNSDVEYLKDMNTKIMSGKAEDILFTAFLPVNRYSRMGIFEDLSSYVSETPEFREENYFMNVLQAAQEENGALYLIPYRASFSVMVFSRTLLAKHPELEEKLKSLKSVSFSEAMDIAVKLLEDTDKKNAFLMHTDEAGYMGYMIQDAGTGYVNEAAGEVRVNTPEYLSLLKQTKAYAEKGYFDMSGMDFYNTEYYFAAEDDFDVQGVYFSLAQNADTAYALALADSMGKVSTRANACVAINSGSEQKELAWEFIRYLLSEEIQTLPCIYGPAVNRQGFEASAKRYYKLYEEGSKGLVDETEYRNVLESCMEQINACDDGAADMFVLMRTENEKYFKGKQTAEETAENLQRYLEQYFYE